jgi:hypothetical protein
MTEGQCWAAFFSAMHLLTQTCPLDFSGWNAPVLMMLHWTLQWPSMLPDPLPAFAEVCMAAETSTNIPTVISVRMIALL